MIDGLNCTIGVKKPKVGCTGRFDKSKPIYKVVGTPKATKNKIIEKCDNTLHYLSQLKEESSIKTEAISNIKEAIRLLETELK